MELILLTKKNSARLSMLNENDVKTHLESTIPKYGIKMNYVGCFNACTFSEVRITCINESSALNLSLGKEITLMDDPVYNKRYVLANLLQDEDFGNIKFSFYDHYVQRENKLDLKSPTEYYDTNFKEGLIEIKKIITKNGENMTIGESGIALSSFLTRGDLNLLILLKSDSINFSELFKNPSLLVAEDLSEFINKLKSLKPKSFKFDENKTSLRIKYEGLFETKGIPLGFPTREKID